MDDPWEANPQLLLNTIRAKLDGQKPGELPQAVAAECVSALREILEINESRLQDLEQSREAAQQSVETMHRMLDRAQIPRMEGPGLNRLEKRLRALIQAKAVAELNDRRTRRMYGR